LVLVPSRPAVIRIWSQVFLLFLLIFLAGLSSAQTAIAGEGNFTLYWPDRTYLWHYNPANKPEWLGEEEALKLVQDAVAGWEDCGVNLTYSGLTDTPPRSIDGKNVIGWKLDGKKYSAWTSWSAHRDGRAIEADVTLYTNIFNQYLGTGVDARLELNKSIIHEIGHVLGLTHSDRPEDVMSVRIRTRPEWQLPSDNDISRCRTRYP
jgi:hypothetical protein